MCFDLCPKRPSSTYENFVANALSTFVMNNLSMMVVSIRDE
jgi:hypothetical protein